MPWGYILAALAIPLNFYVATKLDDHFDEKILSDEWSLDKANLVSKRLRFVFRAWLGAAVFYLMHGFLLVIPWTEAIVTKIAASVAIVLVASVFLVLMVHNHVTKRFMKTCTWVWVGMVVYILGVIIYKT